MRKSDVFQSKRLKKEDITGPTIATIASVVAEKMQEDEDEVKPVAHFVEEIKPMVLNSGNWDTIEQAYGEESNLWTGKRVEIYVDPYVKFKGQKVGGLKIRIPSGNQRQVPSSNGTSLMNIQMALTALQGCGLTKDDLKRCIKAKNPGATGFVAIRDTPVVLAMIEEARQNQGNKEESFDSPPPDEEIPF